MICIPRPTSIPQALSLAIVGAILLTGVLQGPTSSGPVWANPAESASDAPRKRRIIYNFDGDSCFYTRAGSKHPVVLTVEDVKRLIDEIAYPESQVDTMLLCLNAATMYYPTEVGTMRGALTPRDQRAEKWPRHEQQRVENVERFFAQGVDPFALLFSEARQQGLETLITFRMNDAHGNEFLRTRFWEQNPEYQLPEGALDFSHQGVRDHVFALIEEVVRRYDTDGLELDFNRFPTFFRDEEPAELRIEKINALVKRVRELLDAVGQERGKRLVLGARIPSNYGETPPTYETSCAIGCDPAAWARNGWVDFLVVSEFVRQRYDLPIAPWKKRIPQVPIYGSIECTEPGGLEKRLTPAKYRRAARHLWDDGADGIYLFNFFTPREHGEQAHEPHFEVLRDLGDRDALDG